MEYVPRSRQKKKLQISTASLKVLELQKRLEAEQERWTPGLKVTTGFQTDVLTGCRCVISQAIYAKSATSARSIRPTAQQQRRSGCLESFHHSSIQCSGHPGLSASSSVLEMSRPGGSTGCLPGTTEGNLFNLVQFRVVEVNSCPLCRASISSTVIT